MNNLYFLYGPNIFLLKEKLAEIAGKFCKSSGDWEEPIRLGPEGLDFRNLISRSNQISLFSVSRKLVVVENFLRNDVFCQDILSNPDAALSSKSVLVFVQEGDVPKKEPAIFEFLKKNAKSQLFQNFSGQKLEQWVKKEFAVFGKKISGSAVSFLISRTGNDMQLMKNEICKLCCFQKSGDISEKDIEEVGFPGKVSAEIFKTIDAIAARRKKESILFLKKHIEKGDDPFYLLTMFAYQFRNLLCVKDLLEKRKTGELKSLGLHPFVLKKSLTLAEKFSFDQLKKIHQEIFLADFSIKTGKSDSQTALFSLISRI